MAKKQIDTEQQDSDSAIKRITLRFDQKNDNQKIVYEYLKDLPYGSKTDAIVAAILERAARYHEIESDKEKVYEKIRQTIHEEIQSHVSDIAAAVITGIQDKITVMPVAQEETTANDKPEKESADAEQPSGLTEEAFMALELAEMF